MVMSEDAIPQLSELPNGGWDTRLRVFRAGDEVDTCALITQRYVVLVDTMSTPKLATGILESVRPALQGRQLLVVNTHADWDHCWGNAVFATPGGSHPAPILGHEVARERLRGEEERQKLAERQQAEPRFADVRLVPPTLTCADGMRIDGGDLTLELLPTPGHTPDHLAVWVPELRLLLAGDAAEHPFPCVYDAVTLPALLASLHSLAALNAVTLIPCHGGTTDPGLPARNLAYFAAIERHARAAQAAGALPSNWAERDDLPARIGFPFDEAVRQCGADPAVTSPLYQRFHLAAVRVTLELLAKSAPDEPESNR
jgi:glyoxylase-like metal-dependent hydrolase (beta-lactamase superfamily II)